MQFYIDYSILDSYFAQGPFVAMWRIFLLGGWIPLLLFFLYIIWLAWVLNRQNKFVAKWNFVVLAIDIPKLNEQALKAVESVFVALAGTRSGGDFIDKYWNGKVQESFSWEIASIEGYTQFYVRTVTHFRDVVEAAVYAQYPNADIREVPDYTENTPDNFPNEEYDVWSSDIVLTADQAYPIKTYFNFEDQLSGELKDPISNLLEGLSRLGKGEQFWIQIILTPTDDSWKKSSEKVFKKMIGANVAGSKRIIDYVLDFPTSLLEKIGDQVYGREGSVGGGGEAKEPNKIQYLTPGEKVVLEGIQKKMSRVGFFVKIRVVYLAKKEVYNGAKAVSGFFGAFSQYNSLDMNGFRPHKTYRTVKYRIFGKRRLAALQRALMRSYKSRSSSGGGNPYLLNVEELATIYHFPVLQVKAQGLSKMEATRAEAPFSLPTEFTSSDESNVVPLPVAQASAQIQEQALDHIDEPRIQETNQDRPDGNPEEENAQRDVLEPKIFEDDDSNPPNNLPI